MDGIGSMFRKSVVVPLWGICTAIAMIYLSGATLASILSPTLILLFRLGLAVHLQAHFMTGGVLNNVELPSIICTSP